MTDVKQCPKCQRIFSDDTLICHKCISRLKKYNDPKAAEKAAEDDARWERCPRCGSDKTVVIRRIQSFLPGDEPEKSRNMCVNCRHEWENKSEVLS